jgi:hypothetical protein
MAENARHLQAVTPEYSPVERQFAATEQSYMIADLEPKPGLITRIHEYIKERERAIERSRAIERKYVYGVNPDVIQKSPGGLWHDVDPGNGNFKTDT